MKITVSLPLNDLLRKSSQVETQKVETQGVEPQAVETQPPKEGNSTEFPFEVRPDDPYAPYKEAIRRTLFVKADLKKSWNDFLSSLEI